MDFKISNKKDFFYPACLTLIIFAVFFTSIHYPFLKGFDDNAYVLYNKHLSPSLLNILYWFTHSRVGCYLPLTMFSYMFDYNLWGFDSFGYHLQNIFWHIVAVITIYKCFRLFEIKSWIAFFICLIFAIHPQRVESVVWLSERKDVLCAAFYFLCIYSYIKHYDKKFSITAFVFFILSILSKSMAVSLPVILLIYEFYRCNKDKRLDGNTKSACRDTRRVSETCNAQATVIRHAPRVSTERSSTSRSTKIGGCKSRLIRLCPYFIILLIFIPVAIIAQGEAVNSQSQVLSFQRLYTVLYNLYWYISQTIFPAEFNPVYSRQIFFAGLSELILFYTGSILIIMTMLKKNWKFLIYCALPVLLTFVVSLLPVIGIISLGSIDHADRYSYIPSVFIWFSIGLILTNILYDRNIADPKLLIKKTSFLLSSKFIFLILLLYSIVLIILNIQYQRNWSNNYRLFSHAANYTSANVAVLIVLGDNELGKGNYEEVLNIAEKLKKKNKNSSMAAFFEASVIYHFDKKSAIKLLLKAKSAFKPHANSTLDWNIRHIRVLIMLINYYYSAGNKNETIKYIDELLQCKEIKMLARYSFQGMNAECENNYEEAIFFYKKALNIDPKDKDIENKIEKCIKLQKEENNPRMNTNEHE